jgi:hypothetical protein
MEMVVVLNAGGRSNRARFIAPLRVLVVNHPKLVYVDRAYLTHRHTFLLFGYVSFQVTEILYIQ